MCQLALPVSEFGREQFQMISAFQFWEMVDRAGWISEDPVPPTRVTLGYVPDFAKMFQDNGAWIADKTLGRLTNELALKYETQPVIFLAPDEPGARAFAEYMALLHDTATVVYLPADQLNTFRHEPNETDTIYAGWEKAKPAWFNQLTETSTKTPIVFVEEFTKTGNTSRAAMNLVRACRRQVNAHALICDFAPSLPRRPDTPVRVSMYEFQLGH
jgi:hypothetical protein